jgi:hypothetical protein
MRQVGDGYVCFPECAPAPVTGRVIDTKREPWFDADGPRWDFPAESLPPGNIVPLPESKPLNETAADRKKRPLARGVLDYFPDALMEVAYTSWVGNEQHNPGQPMHWAKEKSTDHADCIIRHLKDRGTFDSDGVRHSAKAAWRALALLQTEIEQEKTNG